jgi:hypothetical protein
LYSLSNPLASIGPFTRPGFTGDAVSGGWPPRIYLGAVAGVVFSNSEKIYALKKGFYVIELSGDTFNITGPKGNYHPHEW